MYHSTMQCKVLTLIPRGFARECIFDDGVDCITGRADNPFTGRI